MSIPAGRVVEGVYQSSALMPGMTHTYRLYIPEQAVSGRPLCVYVAQDGMRDFEPAELDQLIAAGRMPPCAGVFVAPGRIDPTLPGGVARSVRCPQYDGLGPNYANFIVRELLPHLEKTYGVSFSADPNDRAIGGASSGGICAFNAAWERPDCFRRVYMNSPTFSAFRGGDILPVLVRKVETKPIRFYMTVGTDDMRNAAGDWYLEALTMNAALGYAGYEFRFEVFDGGGHVHGWCDAAVFRRVMEFLWRGYPEPVGVAALPPRVADIVSIGEPWHETAEAVPAPNPVAPLPVGANMAALSCDRWRVYYTKPGDRFVYAASIQPDGALSDHYAAGWLHAPDDGNIGAVGLCVDREDRLIVGTRSGIQIIDSNGHNNAIIPLPGNLPVTGLGFGGADNCVLYAASGDRVFRRHTKIHGLAEGDPAMKPVGQPL